MYLNDVRPPCARAGALFVGHFVLSRSGGCPRRVDATFIIICNEHEETKARGWSKSLLYARLPHEIF